MPLNSYLLPPTLPNPSHQKLNRINPLTRRVRVLALKRDGTDHDNERNHYKSNKLVDRNMIVLLERIHQMKAADSENEPPSGWMEWEKQYLPYYDSDICEAMGLLQTLLMNTRPRLALGLVALIALSVPTSMAAIAFKLVEIAKLMG